MYHYDEYDSYEFENILNDCGDIDDVVEHDLFYIDYADIDDVVEHDLFYIDYAELDDHSDWLFQDLDTAYDEYQHPSTSKFNSKPKTNNTSSHSNPNCSKNMASSSTYNETEDLELVQALLAKMDKPNSDLVDKLSYQGFDPQAIRATLRKYNSNAAQLTKDIEFLVTLILSRGSNVFTKTSSLVPDIRERFSRLVGVYRIERKLSATSTKNTITLARILKSYPDYAFTILNQKPTLRRPVSVEMMENDFGYKNFPSCLRGEFVFSLVPGPINGNNYIGIIKAVIHYQFAESKILNSRNNKNVNSDNQNLEKIIHYASIAWSNSVIKPEIRKQFMDKTNLTQTTIKAWSDNFDKHFPNHKNIGAKFGE